MAYHMHPVLRFFEEVRETAGIQKAVDSPAITILKTQESQGQRAKTIPHNSYDFIVEGKQYIPS